MFSPLASPVPRWFRSVLQTITLAAALLGCQPNEPVDPVEELPSPTSAVAIVEILRAVPSASFPTPPLDCDSNTSFASHAETGREAGFLATPTGRMFYAYQPHTGDDTEAPLLVFFNGGPGRPTTPYLFASGTAEWTVIWQATELGVPIANIASWARFAHLLYLDAPGAGYSYGLIDPATRLAAPHDAAEFVTAILTFLDCRMDRPDRAVALVGESYGGVRSHHILFHLHHPHGSADGVDDPGYGVAWTAAQQIALEGRVRDHFAFIAEGRGEAYASHSPEVVARQFFGQVLIQPALLWESDPDWLWRDWRHTTWSTQEGRKRMREHQDSPPGFDDSILHRGEDAVRDPVESETLLGVRLEDIPWMSRDSRTLIPHPCEEEFLVSCSNPHYLDDVFGALPVGYGYFNGTGLAIDLERRSPPAVYRDGLTWTSMLITDATLDTDVVSPALPEVLQIGGLVQRSRLRDGWADIELMDGTTRSIRMPRFEAGHTVPMYTPVEIADEVERWLEQVRNTAPAP